MLGRKGQGRVAGVAVDTSSLGGECMGPPTWPPTSPSALGLSSSAAGVLEAGLDPCSETVTMMGSSGCCHVDQTLSMWQLSHLRDTTSQGYTGHRHVLKGLLGLEAYVTKP